MGVFAALLPAALSRNPRNIMPWRFVLLTALPSIEAFWSARFTTHYVASPMRSPGSGTSVALYQRLSDRGGDDLLP
jgi:hypothetical protein